MAVAFRGELPRFVQITGVGRSGSTLVALLLNAHPQICSPGEVTGPILLSGEMRPNYLCSCGVPLFECDFWSGIQTDLAASGIEFGPGHWDMDFQIGHSGLARQLLCRSLGHNAIDELRNAVVGRMPGWGSRLREIGRRNAALVRSVFERTAAPVFVDASKDHVRVRHLRRHAGLDVHVLHLVRDSPAYVASMMKTNWADLEDAIGRWMRNAAHCIRLRRSLHADRSLLLRYEDLCRDPAGEMGRLTAWLGLDPSPDPLGFREVEHHLIGNRMRLGTNSEIRVDESWREGLSESQIETILRRTDPVRRVMGYA